MRDGTASKTFRFMGIRIARASTEHEENSQKDILRKLNS